MAGHDDEARRVDTADARETLKELALLDGAFIASNEGVAVSGARYLDADASGQVTLHTDPDQVEISQWESQVVACAWFTRWKFSVLQEQGEKDSPR